MAQPFLGSRITLISASQIRYEGVLDAIDQVQSTVSLKDVQMFGTEGRRGQNEISPNDKIYSFIMFRAADILELQVVEQPVQPEFVDPAIMTSQLAPPPVATPPAATSVPPPALPQRRSGASNLSPPVQCKHAKALRPRSTFPDPHTHARARARAPTLRDVPP